jgi:hypothetical protein
MLAAEAAETAVAEAAAEAEAMAAGVGKVQLNSQGSEKKGKVFRKIT